MTIWGFDVSDAQSALKVSAAKAQGYTFMVAKVTEGQGYAAASFPSFVAQAKSAGILFAAYHFLRSDSSPTAQADNVAKHLADKSIPVWIDCEPNGASKPTLAMAAAFRAECSKRGVRVAGIYFPHFWWTEQGSPSLAGWALWQALYGGNPPGYASSVYPGDTSDRWAAQGGVVPTILQFDSSGQIDGFTGRVDVNAYKGTRAGLAGSRLFKDYAPTPAPTPTPAPAPGPVTRGAVIDAKIASLQATLAQTVHTKSVGVIAMRAALKILLAVPPRPIR